MKDDAVRIVQVQNGYIVSCRHFADLTNKDDDSSDLEPDGDELEYVAMNVESALTIARKFFERSK